MKNCLIVFITVFMISCEQDIELEQKQYTWVRLNDFPGEARSSGTTIAFSVNGKGYFGLGGNNLTPNLSDIWCFDPDNDTWEQKNDFPYNIQAVESISINDKGYVMTYTGNLYEYDPTLDSWDYVSSFPQGYRPGITGFELNGKGYFGTGNNVDLDNFTLYNDFWQYDPVENDWIPIKDFPGIARTTATSFVIGDIAYVGLGYDGIAGPPFYKDVWSYDDATNEWTQIADFPSSSISGIVFSSKTRGYIGSSKENVFTYCNVYEYDPILNRWNETKKFPSGDYLNTESFNIDDRLFVIGGWWSEYSNQVWEYKIVEN